MQLEPLLISVSNRRWKLAGQTTVYPVSAALNSGGTITVTIKPGNLYRCTELGLRPKNKDPRAVFEDIKARAARGDRMRLGDMSWPNGEGQPWFFEYREKVPGQKRAAPDPDAAILRAEEIRQGIG